jgi:hypothetical protein
MERARELREEREQKPGTAQQQGAPAAAGASPSATGIGRLGSKTRARLSGRFPVRSVRRARRRREGGPRRHDRRHGPAARGGNIRA